MKNLGNSISDAIDSTQDHLLTTRPLAERTLFSLLEANTVTETEDGFILLEMDDDDELFKHHRKVKSQFSQNWKHYRFHGVRKKHASALKKRMQGSISNRQSAEDSPDDDSDPKKVLA